MTNPEITSGRDDAHQPEAIKLRRILRNRYGIALLGLLVLLLLNAVVIRVLPTRYQAAVVIEDRSGKHAAGAFGDGTTSDGSEIGGSPVCFPQTPFEVLTSEKIIAQLSRDLDLPARFQLPEGPAVAERVRAMIRIEPIGGTDLFCLIVTDTEETRAIEIANGIYKAYEKVRDSSVLQQKEHAREVLDNQLREQEGRVQEAKEKLKSLMEKAVLHGISPSSGAQGGRADVSDNGPAEAIMREKIRINDLIVEISDLRTRLKGLQDLEGDALLQKAVMPGIDDADIQKYLPRWGQLLREEEQADLAGIGPNHPDRLGNLEQIATLREILLPAAENHRRTLATKLARMEKQLDAARSSLDAMNSDFQLRSIQYVFVATALHNYEDKKDILADLRVERVKQMNEQTWLQSDTRLLLWSAASSTQRVHPYLPHKLLHPILGVIIGLILGGGLVFLAAKRRMLNSTT